MAFTTTTPLTSRYALRWLPAAALVLGVAALSGCDRGASTPAMPRATPEAPATPSNKP